MWSEGGTNNLTSRKANRNHKRNINYKGNISDKGSRKTSESINY